MSAAGSPARDDELQETVGQIAPLNQMLEASPAIPGTHVNDDDG